MVLGWVFGVGRSNGATFDFQKFKMAAVGRLGYTEMVITLQPVCQSTWFLVLGWGFWLSLDFFSGAFIHALLSCITVASARLFCLIPSGYLIHLMPAISYLVST